MAAARTSPGGGGRGAGDGRMGRTRGGRGGRESTQALSEYTWICILSGWNKNLQATNEYSNI